MTQHNLELLRRDFERREERGRTLMVLWLGIAAAVIVGAAIILN